MQPANWRPAEVPRVPIAGAAGSFLNGHVALIGGFTDRLEATAAVQTLDPRRGWAPIGNALLEARAEPLAIAIDEQRLLVIGGWTGRLPKERRWLASAEICDPRRPERRRPTPPPFDPDSTLQGASAIAIADGRVLLVHQRRGTLFDPETGTWSVSFEMGGHRIGAALTTTGSDPDTTEIIDRIVVAGGHRDGEPAIETITVPRGGEPTSVGWAVNSLPLVADAAISDLIDGAIHLAGGTIENQSTSRTWRLDHRRRTVEAGPELPMAAGVSRATLVRRGTRLLVIGGESLAQGTPKPTSNGAVIDVRNQRVTSLPPGPVRAVRSTVIARPKDVLVVGGYRFESNARPGRRTRVLSAANRLVLPPIVIAD